MTNKNASFFNFFDIVQVIDVVGDFSEIDRLYGVVLGKVQNDDGAWFYSVQICEDAACELPLESWSINEGCLVATGRSVSEDHVYGGETVKVSHSGEVASSSEGIANLFHSVSKVSRLGRISSVHFGGVVLP